jgi:predicted nucleic acid-binding protein
VLLDAEALSAVAEGRRAIQPWLEVVRRTDSTLWTSSLTLAETTDGSARDAKVHRALKAVRSVAVSDDIALAAGRLRAAASDDRRKKRDLTVDAVVAATALVLPAPVILLTSDPSDLDALLVGAGVRVERTT